MSSVNDDKPLSGALLQIGRHLLLQLPLLWLSAITRLIERSIPEHLGEGRATSHEAVRLVAVTN